MSWAMTNQTESGDSAALRSSSEILCSNLSKGLHAAAQPLTILRAGLGIGLASPLSFAELRELAASSYIEVERVCGLFDYLQQLVIVASSKPSLKAAPILRLVADAADGVYVLFENGGLTLSSTMPDTFDPVLIDKVRTLRALSSVLLIVHGLSRARDTVELIVSSSPPKSIRIVVRNLNLYLDELSEEASLGMALAEANIRSQQAGFSWELRPFSVQIEFPTEQIAPCH
jgi:hypothetical protein